MRNIRSILLAVAMLLLLPSTIFAVDVVKEQNGKKCLDLQAAYAEINNTSQAITGQEKSLDAIKRADTLATFSSIFSIFVGDRIYCIKDEVAASKVNVWTQQGLLGMLEETNMNMLVAMPTVNIGEHLAENFVPGYKLNNRTLAQSADDDDYTAKEKKAMEEAKGDSGLYKGLFEDQAEGIFGDFIDGQTDGLQEAVEGEEAGEAVELSGYDYLKDVLKLDKLWSISRNIAYLFLVVVMIVIGFMIMFRKSLPGQVVVSFGNAIPKVVVTLVLITFSFAIVGLMLDVGKISMNLVGNMFVSAYKDAGRDTPTLMQIESVGSMTDQAIYSMSPHEWYLEQVRKIPIIGGVLEGIYSPIYDWLDAHGGKGYSLLLTAQTGVIGGIMMINRAIMGIDWNGLSILGNNVDILFTLAELIVDPALSIMNYGLLVWFLINILMLLVSLYASFKLFITIISTYFKLFMNVVLGPVQIMVGAVPGNFSSISGWLKSTAANVLVFVVIFFMINFFSFIAYFVDPAQFNFFGNNGVLWPNWLIALRGVIVIAGYLFAANAPTIVNGFMKVEQNREMAAAGESVKKAVGKLPLVGGIFNG